MRVLLLNLLLLAALGLFVVAAYEVARPFGLAVAGLACVALYLALADGKGIRS